MEKNPCILAVTVHILQWKCSL